MKDKTLNLSKCSIRTESVSLLCHVTKDGIIPDPKKNYNTPIISMNSLCISGIINYLGKFIPNLSTLAYPLHELLQSNVEFVWEHSQEKTQNTIKALS
ncbi:hypothetical protein PR048_028779 [Dryococelus australis]|uniref:Reverse transcriptase/retrotransposon-derived protein RNase H-like domain-containing protein n=1 Tax=Dryococelus australis TaxID=614101 RepID=A0ABQ9GE14_9NEOP|nr:hypothetical protein PR048_028779 [Dryococelus australis]